MAKRIEKTRYWSGICYPENMVDNWIDIIGDTVQVPYCYCVHDKDLLHDGDESRKVHVHLMLMFPNTTTHKHALNVFNTLSKTDQLCCSTCEGIIYPRKIYDYLIHDTEECRKAGKYQYSPDERIEGNNFDIGSFEQLTVAERKEIRSEMALIILDQGFTNYFDFYLYVISNYDTAYEDVLVSNSGHFERLIKGYYLKLVKASGETIKN